MNFEFTKDCPKHGRSPVVCCITTNFVESEETPVPEEQIREHVKCSGDGCKSVFWRPQEAAESLQTVDLAQLRGWKIVDREKGLVHCSWGHEG